MADTTEQINYQDLSTRKQVAWQIGELLAQLGEVTPAMIEAGSRAAYETQVTLDAKGRRQFTKANEGAVMTAVYRAMIRARMDEIAA